MYIQSTNFCEDSSEKNCFKNVGDFGQDDHFRLSLPGGFSGMNIDSKGLTISRFGDVQLGCFSDFRNAKICVKSVI